MAFWGGRWPARADLHPAPALTFRRVCWPAADCGSGQLGWEVWPTRAGRTALQRLSPPLGGRQHGSSYGSSWPGGSTSSAGALGWLANCSAVHKQSKCCCAQPGPSWTGGAWQPATGPFALQSTRATTDWLVLPLCGRSCGAKSFARKACPCGQWLLGTCGGLFDPAFLVF